MLNIQKLGKMKYFCLEDGSDSGESESEEEQTKNLKPDLKKLSRRQKEVEKIQVNLA